MSLSEALRIGSAVSASVCLDHRGFTGRASVRVGQWARVHVDLGDGPIPGARLSLALHAAAAPSPSALLELVRDRPGHRLRISPIPGALVVLLSQAEVIAVSSRSSWLILPGRAVSVTVLSEHLGLMHIPPAPRLIRRRQTPLELT